MTAGRKRMVILHATHDLMLISETKLSPDILNGEFVPEGYM